MNIYKQKLFEAKQRLQTCQKETQNTLSCINCEKIFDCKIRDEFVNATYESMSEGKSQDFNF